MKDKKRFASREVLIIIIIAVVLASISIPIYLRKSEELKMEKVKTDFAYLANHLDTFKIDWGSYPIVSDGEYFGKNTDDVAIKAPLTIELTGSGTTPPYVNIPGHTALTDRDGGIEYIETGRILMLYNPYNPRSDYYYRTDASGSTWVLSLFLPDGKVLYRTNKMATLTEADVAPIP